MAKTELKSQKVEIVRQLRLTPNQRLQLVQMSNEGKRAHSVDWRVRHDLLALGLIEERPRCTDAEKKEVQREIAALWKSAATFLKKKDAKALDATCDSIRSKEYNLQTKAFWLTPAADEYLTKGKVTVTL